MRWATRLQAILHQLFRIHGKVGLAELGQRDRPDRPFVAPLGVKGLVPPPRVQIRGPAVLPALGRAIALKEVPPSPAHPALLGECHMRFPNRIRVVVVLFGLRQEEHVLVVGRRSRLHRGRHGVGFVPDDVAAENPAVIHQRQSDAPGHTQLLPVAVLVADDDPQRTGVAEHAAAFGQNLHQPLHVLDGSCLVPQLDVARVVPLPVVGRTRDDGIHGLGGQQPELLQSVAAQDGIAPVVRTRFLTTHAAASSATSCQPRRYPAVPVPV